VSSDGGDDSRQALRASFLASERAPPQPTPGMQPATADVKYDEAVIEAVD
jgi:hypothetical protein